MRKSTSFTISSDILAEIAATKGKESTSERVNALLRRALEQERRERLERQAAEFFATEDAESARERAAFQKETIRVLSRD
jgi:hypothetical protein